MAPGKQGERGRGQGEMESRPHPSNLPPPATPYLPTFTTQLSFQIINPSNRSNTSSYHSPNWIILPLNIPASPHTWIFQGAPHLQTIEDSPKSFTIIVITETYFIHLIVFPWHHNEHSYSYVTWHLVNLLKTHVGSQWSENYDQVALLGQVLLLLVYVHLSVGSRL